MTSVGFQLLPLGELEIVSYGLSDEADKTPYKVSIVNG